MRELYKDTLAHMLLALDDDADFAPASSSSTGALVEENGEKEKVWPPWPWPPWDGDDDDKDHGGHEGRRANRTEYAYELAGDVVKFEKQIAKASLDL